MALSWHSGLIKPPKQPKAPRKPVGWLTTREVAELCGVGPQSVREWVRLGKVRASRIGVGLLFAPEDVERAVEAFRVRVAP